MHRSARPVAIVPSTLRRITAFLAVVAFAALVAAGCGGDGGSDDAGESGIVGNEGPLAWLPTDTWMVASARVDARQLDTAIDTLDRLPAWSLVESFLPADDGAGLRRALLKEMTTAIEDESGKRVTARQLEQVFGEQLGLALLDTNFDDYDDHPPIFVWVEVDDEDAANALVRRLAGKGGKEREYEGVSYVLEQDKSGDAAVAVEDGLLLIAASESLLKEAIRTHDGDHSLADDDTARAVIEGGIGDAVAGAAVQTDPLLEAAPKLVSTLADEADDPKDAARAKLVAARLGPVLKSAAVDGLVADWTSMSVTIDSTGLRVRGAWSNPHDLADPEVGSRELVERMPVDAPIASAMATDGTMLGRAQDAWKEVKDAYHLDLHDLATQCAPKDRWACDLGAEAATAVLEDEDLAAAMEDRGDVTSAYVQDLSGALENVMRTAKGAAPKAPTGRVVEVASTGDPVPDWTPPADLTAAAKRAGLFLTSNADHTKFTIRVQPGSPLATALQTTNAEETNVVAQLYGIWPEQLLTPAGVTFDVDEVDGIHVTGLPNDAPSKVVPALEGDADTLGDDDDYARVVKAANPPKDVGLYGYMNLKVYIESIFGSLAAGDQDMARVMPTIRNNLADAPGLVVWSGRDKVDGEEIGVWEYVLPILE